AAFPDMPRTAASVLEPHFVARATELPVLLVRLSSEVVSGEALTAGERTPMEINDFERPIAFSCPECGGALRRELKTGFQEYGCHVGHRFGASELLEAQSEGVERGIYVALRMLNEQAEFARQMIKNARDAPLDNGLGLLGKAAGASRGAGRSSPPLPRTTPDGQCCVPSRRQLSG